MQGSTIFLIVIIIALVIALIYTIAFLENKVVAAFVEGFCLVLTVFGLINDLNLLPKTEQVSKTEQESTSISTYISNPFSGLHTNDTIECGYYNNESIRWKVVDTNGNRAFLLAEQAIACRPYNTEFTDTTWASSDLRAWLNYDFINAAFDSEIISYIADTTVVTYRSNDTVDKIFILSLEEVEQYCPSASSRKVKAVAAARSKSECDQYWLRTPGRYMDYTMCVKSDGSIVKKGYEVTNPQVNVRPAMWVYTD